MNHSSTREKPLRLFLLACEVLFREVCHCIARSKNVVDVKSVTQGLHDLGAEKMSARLQSEIDAVENDKYHAVLLGYGLCSNGILNLKSNHHRLVVPRAHDCITFFLGSKEKYREYFDQNPGTYFKTTGWMERDRINLENVSQRTYDQFGLLKTYRELLEKYGEDNARYLMEALGGLHNYSKFAYIDMSIADETEYRAAAEQEAKERQWQFEIVKGDLTLLQNLTDGPWDEKFFLVLQPGQMVVPSYDHRIIDAKSVDKLIR